MLIPIVKQDEENMPSRSASNWLAYNHDPDGTIAIATGGTHLRGAHH